MARLKITKLRVTRPVIEWLKAKRLEKVARIVAKPGIRIPEAKKPGIVAKRAKSLLSTAFLLLLAFWQLVFIAKYFWRGFFFHFCIFFLEIFYIILIIFGCSYSFLNFLIITLVHVLKLFTKFFLQVILSDRNIFISELCWPNMHFNN